MPVTYAYPRPALTADAVLFTIRDHQLELLLIRRNGDPFAGCWALPGGFCEEGEQAEYTVVRELEEEAGVRDVWLEQLKTFDTPSRDPRGWVVSVAHFALVNSARVQLRSASDASDVRWWPVAALPPLAFDHPIIVRYAVQRLRNKLQWDNIGSQLLPPRFTMAALREVHEAVLGESLQRPLDKRNFHKRMLDSGAIRET